MKMSESLKHTKEKVEFLLSEYPQLRDSDKLLWLAFLSKFHDLKNTLGDEAYGKLKQIIMDKKTPTMESVRRVRQKIQEQGLFIGAKRKYRMAESEDVKETLKLL